MQNNELTKLLIKITEKEEVNDFLIVLHGSLNQEIVTKSVQLIESKCRELNYHQGLITRLKMISVEILQNITKHQHISNEVLPYFIVGALGSGVCIYSGNIVNNVTKNVINDRLTVYNNLDADKLKNFYRDSLKQTTLSKEGDAGLGLLDIVYRSNQNVEFNFHEFKNDLHYFGLNVNIDNITKTNI
jgi:hypothetical protein